MSEHSSHAESARRRALPHTGDRLATTLMAVVELARESNCQAEVSTLIDDGWTYTFRATPPGWSDEDDEKAVGLTDAEDMVT